MAIKYTTFGLSDGFLNCECYRKCTPVAEGHRMLITSDEEVCKKMAAYKWKDPVNMIFRNLEK